MHFKYKFYVYNFIFNYYLFIYLFGSVESYLHEFPRSKTFIY